MELFKITFTLCYYLGLYPFYYRRNEFKITKFGVVVRFTNAAIFFVSFSWRIANTLFIRNFNYEKKLNSELSEQKWIELLPYLGFVQIIFVLYHVIATSTQNCINFLNYCMQICGMVGKNESSTFQFSKVYFLLISLLNFMCFFVFNIIVWRLTGATEQFFTTYGVLHCDIILLSFETVILFILNTAAQTLSTIEQRLLSIQMKTCQFDKPKFFKTAKRLSVEQCQEIRKLRIHHYHCTVVVEKLINRYKFMLLFVILDNYLVMLSYSYFSALTIYLHLSHKQSKNLIFTFSASLYVVSKIIRLWALCETDNLLNEKIKRIQYVLHKLTLPFQFADNIKEVRIFQYQCFVKPIKLTVAGLFNLDTNFLQSSLGAALAYVVLMLQYSNDNPLGENNQQNTSQMNQTEATWIRTNSPFATSTYE